MIEYQVEIDNLVLEQLHSRFIEAAPSEAYAFLGGKIVGRFCYSINIIYTPMPQAATRYSFRMTEEARVQANAFISGQGLDLIGIAHSHHSSNGRGLLPSINDARLQQDNHLILSLIMTFPTGKGGKQALTCWLNGFAAPLDIRVRDRVSREMSQVLELL